MPRLNRRATFDRIKHDAELRAIPVVSFSTSDNETDRSYFLEKKVAYLTKPLEHTQLQEAGVTLASYCIG